MVLLRLSGTSTTFSTVTSLGTQWKIDGVKLAGNCNCVGYGGNGKAYRFSPESNGGLWMAPLSMDAASTAATTLFVCGVFKIV